MRQVARRLRDGSVELVDVPDPSPGPGMVSVRLEASIISSGTERASLDVARKSLMGKARARPDQARQLLGRARREGIRSTAELVRARLDELGPLGYSAAGTVLEAGRDAHGVTPGQRVAIGGGGFATHAEIDVVPSLLCAPVPDGISTDDAAFATLGAIALHGFRRSGAELGSTVAVIGLGLIGQLACRVARAAGCRVLGVDLEERLARLARACGAEAVERAALGERWRGRADAVLICASTPDSDPVELAAGLARDRAAVVVVGDVRMEVPRGPFYEKELDLRLSRSYGPGRYDPEYELHGNDYPIGYVRWTERRNMEAFLGLVADGSIKPSELVTHRFALSEAQRAFEVLTEERPVAIQLAYQAAPGPTSPVRRPRPAPRHRVLHGRRGPRFGVIGAGRFATATLIPGLLGTGLEPVAIASARGLSAEGARRRFGFSAAHASAEELLYRDDLDLIVIATRHDSHAELTSRALERGVPVYVEKPLALSSAELQRVGDAQRAADTPLFVGFNRRHAPLAERIRELPDPRLMVFRVNAGRLGRGHWLNDLARGGGRLLGEGCHFVDFLCDQAPADPLSVAAGGFPSDPELPIAATDNFQLQIRFADGSSGTVHYSADAPAGPGKERFETSAPGAYAVIEDFRRGAVWEGGRRRKLGSRRQDKGFAAQFASVAAVLRGEADPPDADSYVLSTLTTLAAVRSLQSGEPERVMIAEPDSPLEEEAAAVLG